MNLYPFPPETTTVLIFLPHTSCDITGGFGFDSLRTVHKQIRVELLAMGHTDAKCFLLKDFMFMMIFTL